MSFKKEKNLKILKIKIIRKYVFKISFFNDYKPCKNVFSKAFILYEIMSIKL